MTVTEAFAAFKSELELPDRLQKQAAATQQEMRSKISQHLYVPNSFLIGSYPRYTKIYPLNDIDVLLARNDERVGLTTDGSGTQPWQAVSQVVDAAQKAYPNAIIKCQSRSVNVQIKDCNFGFDLVPAWLRNPDGYWIPDTDSNSWLPTHPEWQSELLTNANKRSGDMLKPLIKMVKHWSRNNYDLLRSFHIELICVEIFANKSIPNYQVGVATTLVGLGSYVSRTMMDPAYGVSRVDKPLSPDELSQLTLRVTSDADESIKALQLETAGDHAGAIEKWRRIFLRGFPK